MPAVIITKYILKNLRNKLSSAYCKFIVKVVENKAQHARRHFDSYFKVIAEKA
jgi:hypothetical protein